jgi:hypothetical protein
MSSRIIGNLTRSLALVPATTFLLHLGAAQAADAQQLAQRVLLGGAPTVSVASEAQRRRPAAGPARDAQEHARRLLLGATPESSDLPQGVVTTVSGHRRHGDAQVLAQQLLHGHRDALTGS